ncbi:MAG: 16S rRNA (uracil(1498)-N(3))-methyltransferase [Pseudomonadota bacterium]
MRVSRLFVDMPLAKGERVQLGDDRAHYLKHVLRCTEGQPLVLFNGQGGEFSALVRQVGKRVVEVELTDWHDTSRESALHTTIGLAVTKRDAMDLAIQKCTELGATTIQPLITRFNTVPAKALPKRREHWQQVACSACEQCERNLPPAVGELMTLDAWLARVEADLKIVLHPGGASALPETVAGSPASVAVLVGPEGGLAEAEVSDAIGQGFVQLAMGPRILRAETAPLAILTLLQSRWGDLGTLP